MGGYQLRRLLALLSRTPTGSVREGEYVVAFSSVPPRLKVPISALFRHGEHWNVCVIGGARARRCEMAISQRGALEDETVKHLNAGEQVVRHPSNDIGHGRRGLGR